MAERRRETFSDEIVSAAGDVARGTGKISTATFLTALVSLLALVFSGISLYQTVLKQAQLSLFVPNAIAYTRDPNGSFEVLVVPITVANSGARDGIVSSLKLKMRDPETKIVREFDASYFADPGYFSTREDITKGLARPKRAFAPLTVPGRSGYSGTVLFYPRKYSKGRVVTKAGTFELELSARMKTVERLAGIDQIWSTRIEPLAFKATLPAVSPYFRGRMLSGYSLRLFVDEK